MSARAAFVAAGANEDAARRNRLDCMLPPDVKQPEAGPAEGQALKGGRQSDSEAAVPDGMRRSGGPRQGRSRHACRERQRPVHRQRNDKRGRKRDAGQRLRRILDILRAVFAVLLTKSGRFRIAAICICFYCALNAGCTIRLHGFRRAGIGGYRQLREDHSDDGKQTDPFAGETIHNVFTPSRGWNVQRIIVGDWGWRLILIKL